MVFAGYSSFLHQLQLASYELAYMAEKVTKNEIPNSMLYVMWIAWCMARWLSGISMIPQICALDDSWLKSFYVVGHLDRVVHGLTAEEILQACDENMNHAATENLVNPTISITQAFRRHNLATFRNLAQQRLQKVN